MSEPTFSAIPIIRIFDETKAKEYYLGFLGFKTDWEHRFHDGAPLYTQVSRGGMTLHLSEHHGDCTPGSRTYVPTTGLDDYHKEITSKGYRGMNPGLQEQPWGAREMTVTDPFGNRLTFAENIEATG